MMRFPPTLLLLITVSIVKFSSGQLNDCIFDNTDFVYSVKVAPIQGYGVAGMNITGPMSCIMSCDTKSSIRLSVSFLLADPTAAKLRDQTKKLRTPGKTEDAHPYCKDETAFQEVFYALNRDVTDPQAAAIVTLNQLNRPGWGVITILKYTDLTTYEGDEGFFDDNVCILFVEATVNEGTQLFWHVIAGKMRQ